MEIEKKAFLVGGAKNDKTREKIRLKMRQLLNNYKKCLIGISSSPDLADVAYKLGKDGYKHLFCIYKSVSLENVLFFEEFFSDMYCNEIEASDVLKKEYDEKDSSAYFVYIVGKKSKKAF